jgi:exosortase/archaeosortase
MHKQVIEKAIPYLRKGWCKQHAFQRDGVFVDSSRRFEADCFCAYGAIIMACGVKDYLNSVASTIVEDYNKVMPVKMFKMNDAAQDVEEVIRNLEAFAAMEEPVSVQD